MTKSPFSQYTPRVHGGRNIEEATSEIQREMDVRKRLYDRWVAEGKMSWTDAHDRMCRLMSALRFMIAYSAILDQDDTSEGPITSTPLSLTPQISLDDDQRAAA